MQFRNLSGLTLPKALWRDLAAAVDLGTNLRRAEEDEIGLYRGRTLRMTIYPRLDRKPDNTLLGSYTSGHISLYPCSRCEVPFLTEVYVHELMHAWVDEFRPHQVYLRWDACPLADRVAAQAFTALGGTVSPDPLRRFCQGYRLETRQASAAVPRVSALFRKAAEEIPWAGASIETF